MSNPHLTLSKEEITKAYNKASDDLYRADLTRRNICGNCAEKILEALEKTPLGKEAIEAIMEGFWAQAEDNFEWVDPHTKKTIADLKGDYSAALEKFENAR